LNKTQVTMKILIVSFINIFQEKWKGKKAEICLISMTRDAQY